MAKATRHIQRNEEHYVAKMNFRSEKILQNQIERLNKEKLLQVKSLNAQMRNYERKLQKINDRALEVEKLSRNFSDPSQRLPTREHFNKLSSDATYQRHMATGVGYSYIDQLLGASKPLVGRPLRWGINPSLPTLQQQASKPITLVTDDASSKTFLTEIKGQPIYLRPREAVFIKRQHRPNTLVLPPIALKRNQKEPEQLDSENSSIPRDSLSEKANRKFRELALPKENDNTNQNANSQLSPILESEIEETERRMKVEDEGKNDAEISEGEEKVANVEGKLTDSKPVIITETVAEKPDIVLENSDPSLDEEINANRRSSLQGHFTTEYEFPTHSAERFTRSSEMLNVDTSHLQTDEQHSSENKSNSFRYQLHGRRFSL